MLAVETQPKRAAVAASLLALLATVPSSARAVRDTDLPDRPHHIGDLFLVDQYGAGEGGDANNVDWFCRSGGQGAQRPTNKLCQDSSSPVVFGQFWDQLNARPDWTPRLLRVAKARSQCVDGQTGSACGTAIPVPTACPTAGATPYCSLKSLKAKGIELGVVIGARQTDNSPARQPRDIAWQACEIQRKDTEGIYDFVFLDQAQALGTQLPETVRHMRDGEYVGPDGNWKQGDCGPGWDVITNDNQWNKTDHRLAPYAWGHAKNFDRASSVGTLTRVATDSTVNPITPADQDFLNEVRQLQAPVTTGAVLRFEVPSESSNLAKLSQANQCTALSRFARHQSDGFEMIYPFFDQGLIRNPNDRSMDDLPYDSFKESTALKQFNLMQDPNSSTPCQ